MQVLYQSPPSLSPVKNLAYDLVQIHSGGSPEANRFPARASPTALTAFDIMIRFSLHCYYELEDSD